MNTRQRVSWLILACYLLSTFYCLHYLLDIGTSYSRLALDHSQYYRKLHSEKWGFTDIILSHVVSIPFTWWLVILLIPYLSIFTLLISCTKTDPHATPLVAACDGVTVLCCGQSVGDKCKGLVGGAGQGSSSNSGTQSKNPVTSQSQPKKD